MANDLSLVLAFGAGLLSFLSPCVLPLIPSYLTFIGGVSLDDLKEETSSRRNLLLRTVFFVLGFGGVFIALGLVFSGSMILLGGITGIINIIAGAVVVLLGLNIIFDFLAFLNYEKKFHPSAKPRGLFGSFLVGMAFGAGWSPCVGPILGGILFLAGQTGEIGRSVLYLSAYSLGLGLPFFGAALFFDPFLKSLGKMKKHLPLIKKASGLLLIFVGLLIMLGKFQELNRFFLQTGSALAEWDNSGTVAVRLIPAILLFIGGALPLLVRIRAKRPPFSRGTAIFLVLTWAFGLAHLTGLLSLPGIAANWLLYQGI
jgi:cytochrome c-type biogenesis protein